MSRKRLVIIFAIISVVILIIGISLSSRKQNGSSSGSVNQNSVDSQDGDFKPYTDKSIRKYPAASSTLSESSELSFEYDNSIAPNDKYSLLNYELFYVTKDGSVVSMGGAPLTSKGNGIFSITKPKISADAKGSKGFIKLSITYDVKVVNDSTTAQSANLGLYEIGYK